MTDSMVRAMQLIGSLMAWAAAATAVAWYVVLYPFERRS